MKTLLRAQQNAHTALIETIRQEAHDYVIRMLEQAILARQRMFGASSEQMTAQSRLFDEAEVLAQTSTEAQDTAPQEPEQPLTDVQSAKPDVKPARGKRVALATGLVASASPWPPGYRGSMWCTMCPRLFAPVPVAQRW
ncbi:MAG: hypothetical protein NTY26_09870 [Burkholderiales bacterium]|nr:hypothetical protein [Burkholderiales bacterium]